MSKQETARRGNVYGIVGMIIAITATFLSGEIENFQLIPLMLGGAVIGAVLAKRGEMTSMPELVAILHSFVGLAAVLVGMASFLDPSHDLLDEGIASFMILKFFSGCLSGSHFYRIGCCFW